VKKLQLITAVIAFLSAFVPAKADQIVQVNVDYGWGSADEYATFPDVVGETVKGSFLWDVDTSTLFDASFQTTGPFTILCDPTPPYVQTDNSVLKDAVFPATHGAFFQINVDTEPLPSVIGTVVYNKAYFICNGDPECLAILPGSTDIWYGHGEETVTAVPEPSTSLLLLVPLPFLLIYWSGGFHRSRHA